MNDPVTYFAVAIGLAVACLVIYLASSLILAARRRKREALRRGGCTSNTCTTCATSGPRAKVYAADFAGDTPDERLTRALEWAQAQITPPMIVMEDGVTHFRTVRVYNGVRLTTEGQR